MAERVLRWSIDVAIAALGAALLFTALIGPGALELDRVRTALPATLDELVWRWSAALRGAWPWEASAAAEAAPRERASRALDDPQREMRALESRLDEIEARLLAGLSTVQLWRELAERHQAVSQIACESAEGHLKELVAAERRDRLRRAKVRRDKGKDKARPSVSGVAAKP